MVILCCQVVLQNAYAYAVHSVYSVSEWLEAFLRQNVQIWAGLMQLVCPEC